MSSKGGLRKFKIEARYYKRLEGDVVKCHLCAHLCRITEGERGICGVRENRNGTLFTLVYGRLISENIDPIEKKPLFHFQPNTRSLSIATMGCNFRCLHCQNYEISQNPDKNKEPPGKDVPPYAIVDAALQYGCKSISYTYTEPTIFMEYAYDTAVIAAEKGIKNVLVTNGYMTAEVLKDTKPYFHAANIDLKSMRDEHYRRVCGARLEPVLESIRVMKEIGIWVEVTTLIIPKENDSEEELREIARFIHGTDPDIPWHISAFHPTYMMTHLPRTPASTINRAREIGLAEGLRFVYTGNLPGDPGENTYCYNCKKPLIERHGFFIKGHQIKDSCCPFCKTHIPGVEMGEYRKGE
ncbi:MAG: AmmeMemoRadiSam system radical SAM enzyme [Thermodesulfobacteriota bacterium]